jgi:hypothetical protein
VTQDVEKEEIKNKDMVVGLKRSMPGVVRIGPPNGKKEQEEIQWVSKQSFLFEQKALTHLLQKKQVPS